MKRVVLLFALILVAVGVSAQNAKVIQIDRDDARDAKAKWEALQKAQADWEAVTERVKKDYTYVSTTSKECGEHILNADYCYRKGWDNNFDFSSDFRFIVPKPQQVQACAGWGCNTFFTPAYTTGIQTQFNSTGVLR